MRRSWIAAVFLLACAAVPDPPPPGTAQAFGRLHLVPRPGVTPGGGGDASYADRRLRDVEFVDYSRPGFAVVYVEDPQPPGGELELAIRASRVGTRIDPDHGAVGAGGHVVLRNDTDGRHVVSYPAAGVVRPLEPGERAEFAVPRAGEQSLFLIDLRDASATLFAAPGVFDTVSPSGRFSLTGVSPGSRLLRVWHPRFPPTARRVELAPDASVELELELGVGRDGHAQAH